MNRPVVIGLILIPALSFGGFRIYNASSSPPPSYPLKFVETAFDCGPQNSHSRLSHDFIFTNVSPRAVTMLPSSTSCGCTSLRLSRSLIAPGQSATAHLVVEPGSALGRMSQFADLRYREAGGDVKSQRLSVQGYVNAKVMITPPGVFFGQTTSGQIRDNMTRSFYLLDTSGEGLVVDRIRASSPKLSYQLHDLTPEDAEQIGFSSTRGYRVAVRLAPGIIPGHLAESLQIWSRDSPSPLVVPVTAEIRGDLIARPASIFFGMVRAESRSDSVVSVDLLPISNREDLKILDIVSSSPYVKVKISQARRLQAVLKNPRPGLLKTSVRIRYVIGKDAHEGTLTLPVYAEVSGSGQTDQRQQGEHGV